MSHMTHSNNYNCQCEPHEPQTWSMKSWHMLVLYIAEFCSDHVHVDLSSYNVGNLECCIGCFASISISFVVLLALKWGDRWKEGKVESTSFKSRKVTSRSAKWVCVFQRLKTNLQLEISFWFVLSETCSCLNHVFRLTSEYAQLRNFQDGVGLFPKSIITQLNHYIFNSFS